MSKHNSTNQFKDGLMMDVHPLQTPNTVLTDCLNGTFITYNGNEHVLQNDMGNFKLEKCKLKENYVPIGTASYGDILYIASYNPIDKKFELGSYPSPLQWNSSEDENPRAIDSAVKTAYMNAISQEKLPIFNYTELTAATRTIVYDSKSLKILPGDQYKISEQNVKIPTIESYEYFILDDNNVTHKIVPKRNESDWQYADWQVPGYLCVKNKILTPFEHNLICNNSIVAGNSVTFSLSSIITVYDEDLCKKIKEFKDNLFYQFKLQLNNDILGEGDVGKQFYNSDKDVTVTSFVSGNQELLPWLQNKWKLITNFQFTVNYGENDYFIQKVKRDSSGNPVKDINGKIIYDTNVVPTTILITPVFKANTNEGIGEVYSVVYDNLTTSWSTTADGTNQNKIAEDVFYWTYSEDTNGDKQINIWYDVMAENDGTPYCISYASVKDLLSNAHSPITWNEESASAGISGGKYTIDYDNDYEQELFVVFFRFGSENDEYTTSTADFDNSVKCRFVYVNFDKKKEGYEGTREDLLSKLDDIGEGYLKTGFYNGYSVNYNSHSIPTPTATEDLEKFITTEDINWRNLFTKTEFKDSVVSYKYDNGEISFTSDSESVEKLGLWKNLNINKSYYLDLKNSDPNGVSFLQLDSFKIGRTFNVNVPATKVSGFENPRYYHPYINTRTNCFAPSYRRIVWHDGAGNKNYFCKNYERSDEDAEKWVSDPISQKDTSGEKSTNILFFENLFDKIRSNVFTNSMNGFIKLRLGCFKRSGGPNMNVYKSGSTDSIYIGVDTKETDETSDNGLVHLMMLDSSGDYCLIRWPGISNDRLDTNIKNFYYLYPQTGEDTWSKYYLCKYVFPINDNPYSYEEHTVHQKVTYGAPTSQNTTYYWLIEDNGDVAKLNCGSAEFDVNSQISKLTVNKSLTKVVRGNITWNDWDKIKTTFADKNKKFDNAANYAVNLWQSRKEIYDMVDENGGGKISNLYIDKDAYDTTSDVFKFIAKNSTFNNDKKMWQLTSRLDPSFVLYWLGFGCTVSGDRRVNIRGMKAYIQV